MNPAPILSFLILAFFARPTAALEPIPDKLVVLTFDDSVASHHSVVRPILKKHGFGATFFITEGFSFRTNKQDYMTWTQIKELNDDGFEIGNHTRDHLGVAPGTLGRLPEQLEAINLRCQEQRIPKPVSFAYPGNTLTPGALPILKKLGIRFARRGGAPEHPYDWGRGFAFEPGLDHPLLIPSAGDARPDWTLQDFRRAADQARAGRIAVLQFHGVPDRDHPWVHTAPENFEQFMTYLAKNNFKVIALRDLASYVDPNQEPLDPSAVISKRTAERKEIVVDGEILDAGSGARLGARLYIRSAAGQWHFAKSASAGGAAFHYERRNWIDTNVVEIHTTLSADPFRVELPPGRYEFRVERGKEFFPESQEVEVKAGLPKLTFRLRRWINMAEHGWFSGDTHIHRDPAELPVTMLAEDLNLALPMIDWTTSSTTSPSESGRGFRGDFGSSPVSIDATHAWSPRNTEYEIFKTGETNHTLGALLILNHKTRFDQPIFPLRAVAEKARREGALLDLEKHNWPWSLALVPLLKVDLFELANNHHWSTDYAIKNWAVPAPAWMGLSGSGSATERDWTLYGFQTYYALLNCGFPLRPAAGTANGVHPVPLGFSRVYVHLDEPFQYDAWMRGLGAGRSFVTTGPMIVAKVNGQWSGFTFTPADPAKEYQVECSVLSEQPLESIELIVNGEVSQKFKPINGRRPQGSFETKLTTKFGPKTTSWLAWRCFEARPPNRFRFAHTGPWRFEITNQPLAPRRVEANWLVERVKEEMARSQGIAPEGLIEDYRQALAIYERIAEKAK